jgi:hypothetical protein
VRRAVARFNRQIKVDGLGPPLHGAVACITAVGKDLVEPCLEIRAALEGIECTVGTHCSLLHDVLRIGRIARHGDREAERVIEERFEQRLERVLSIEPRGRPERQGTP